MNTNTSADKNNKSKKGFLAIDLDGTALVEKIDKNPLYGVLNSNSNFRKILIQNILAAQKEGYDIVILTARPEMVEFFLKWLNIGTKDTESIVNHFEEHGIKIKQVARSPAGLKGNKMKELIASYPEGAIGMLFDDQLKQIKDVQKKNEELKSKDASSPDRLLAFDINSAQDLLKFLEKINLNNLLVEQDKETQHPYHPEQIIEHVKNDMDETIALNFKSLIENVNNIDEKKYPTEKQVMKELFADLAIRYFEAKYRKYDPETEWVVNVMQVMNHLTNKLNQGELISHQEIKEACNKIFHTSHLSKVTPNSSAETLARQMLEECRKIPIIEDMKSECRDYINNTSISDDSRSAVQEMLQQLEHENPTTALQSFSSCFDDNKGKLQQTKGGNRFINAIRKLLIHIPKIGDAFKTAEEKLKSHINSTNRYKDNLNNLKKQTVDNETKHTNQKNHGGNTPP